MKIIPNNCTLCLVRMATPLLHLVLATVAIMVRIYSISFDFAVIFGEDVAFGGVFRCTVGLAEKYGMYQLQFLKRLLTLFWARYNSLCFLF